MAFVYSCCFWFSLRLGGILIALFSIVQATIMIIIFGVAHSQPHRVKEHIDALMSSMNLIYVRHYMELIQANIEKYTSYCITFNAIYVVACLVYIYGAYMFKNVCMIAYILLELTRLVVLLSLVVTWLLVLKENTMDIGLLIGASVMGGFGLLGLCYLWVCSTNLPIVISEMEREERLATISRLERMLENTRTRFSNLQMNNDYGERYGDVFVLSKNNRPRQPALPRIGAPKYSSQFLH